MSWVMASVSKYRFNIGDFQRGDERALQYIFQAHWREFVLFAKKYVGDQEAEDVVSETLNKTWDRRGNFENLSALRAFIYLSIKNRALDKIDKRKTEQRVAAEYSERLDREPATEDIEMMMTHVVESEVLQRLDLLTEQLPPRIREVIELTKEGDSVSSISNKLGVARQVIYRYKDRGVELLRGGLRTQDLWKALLLLVLLNPF